MWDINTPILMPKSQQQNCDICEDIVDVLRLLNQGFEHIWRFSQPAVAFSNRSNLMISPKSSTGFGPEKKQPRKVSVVNMKPFHGFKRKVGYFKLLDIFLSFN